MAVKPPIIRSISWPAVLLQLGLVGGLAFGLAKLLPLFDRTLDPALAFFCAALVHLIFYRVMRNVLSRDFRRGFKRLRRGEYAEAAGDFETSIRHFGERPWLDRYRWILLGGASTMSYREMSLCNAAFCHSQTGNGARAIELYEQTVREFPHSRLANTALNLIRSVQRSAAS